MKKTKQSFHRVTSYLVLLFLVFTTSVLQKVNAQTQNEKVVIRGTVTDVNNQTLAGANIAVKGKQAGAVTDSNGKFSIEVRKGEVLVISYVNMTTTEIVAEKNTTITVQLQVQDKLLEEVVIVGYSSKKAKYLSSAVSTVSGDKLRDVTSNNLASLLQGKAPGVVVSSASGDPTAGSNILIRGAGTISAGSGPLVVVDGNIGGTYNPSDVESVTILKDAAATGLYGSRAGNGVMIITTKSGKSGKSKIEFSSVVGLNSATTGNFKLMNTNQLFDYLSSFSSPNPAMKNINTNWWDLTFRQSLTQNYTLSASGGNDKTQYYVSGNLYKEEGTLIENNKTAHNFRTNLTHRFSDKLKLSVLLNGIYTKDKYNPEGGLYQAYTYLPFDASHGADGRPVDSRYVTWYGRDQSNYLYSMQYDMSNARSFNLSSDVNLEYSISKHLNFSTYNRASFFDYSSMSFYDKRSQGGATNGGELYNSESFSKTFVSSNRLRYDNSFGNHNIAVLAVGEATQSAYDVLSTSVKGLPPGRPFASTATAVINVPTGGRNEYSFHKYLAQADYNFANKYFAVASFVRDRSSRFGNNNSAANFYQLGASWILTTENFMKNIRAINFLKLRVSYGTTGNAEIGDYASLGLYSLSTSSSYAGQPGAAPSQKANPNLTWEKQKAANIGIDITLLKRIELSVDLYQKTAEDLLYRKPLPATTGYSFIFENVGSVRNRGIEFSLTTKNILKRDFTWETNLNMAFNRNKVLSLNAGALFSNPGAAQPIGVGHDMDEWNLPVWAGVDPANGDPLWEKVVADANGKRYITYTNNYNSVANATSRQYLGKSSAPKFSGGISNTVTYKNFTLSAFMNFVYGNYVYNDTRFYYDNDGNYDSYNSMVFPKEWTRWQKAGDIATHPKALPGGNKLSNASSSRYLENGSYIRLRNITLGYNLPQNLLTKMKISGARLFISGDNLWTGTNFSGPDPEVVLSSGVSSFRYPTSKKILFGLSVSF